MERLKGFRNWLGYVYSACWGFRQQFVQLHLDEEQAIEAGDSGTVESGLVNCGPTNAAASSDPQSGVVRSSIASVAAPVELQKVGPAQVELAQAEPVTPIEQVAKPTRPPIEQVIAKPATPPIAAIITTPATSVEKIRHLPPVNDKEHVITITEPKKVITPASKVGAVPQPPVPPLQVTQPQVASPPVAVSFPKAQAPQASPANIKPKSTNGGASESQSETGKYEPGAVNDQTAQRLARLLVSEIKLYYKSQTDGESGSELINVYDVLKDPIDKSRQHYKRRMGEKAIKAMPDYFHGELVRLLCGGDPSRLGPNYQASVERN